MARIKTRKAPVNVFLIIFLGIIGIALTGLIAFALLKMRDQNVLFFEEDVTSLTKTYEKLEDYYIDSVQTVVQKQTPISIDFLAELKKSYTDIQEKLKPLPASDAKAELLQSLYERENKVVILQSINELLIAQQVIGEHVTKFQNCTKNISFGQESKNIVAELNSCQQDLSEAQALALQINKSSLSLCEVERSPSILLGKMNEQHTALTAYYSAVSTKNAKEATIADQNYRSLTSELARTPGWNTCIALSIAQQSDLLKEY